MQLVTLDGSLFLLNRCWKVLDRIESQKVSTRPGSNLDKVLNTCTSKSPHVFIRIWCVRHPSGWSWNGLAVDFWVSTFWSEKTVFFSLASQNLIKLLWKPRYDAENCRTLRWIYSSFDPKVEDLKTVWLLTSWCHHGGSHNRNFWLLTSLYILRQKLRWETENLHAPHLLCERIFSQRAGLKGRVSKGPGCQCIVDTVGMHKSRMHLQDFK